MLATRDAPADCEAPELPLSVTQQARWMQYLLAPFSAAYNVNFVLELGPEADLKALRRSVELLIERHPILRTTYCEGAAGSVQRILPDSPPVWKRIEIVSESASEMQSVLDREADEPFDLERGPVLRVNALCRGGTPLRLQIVVHHIAMDFASVGIFLSELSQLYEQLTGSLEPSRLPRPPGYAEYAQAQRAYLASEGGARSRGYWAEKLRPPLPILALPIDHPYPELPSFSGARVVRTLGTEETAALRRLSRENRVTPYMAMLTCFALWLRRVCGQDDLVIGTPMDDRPADAAMIGDFANTLPLRFDLAGRGDFEAAVRHVREELFEAMEHARAALAAMISEAKVDRSERASPVFQALFVWNRFDRPRRAAPVQEAPRLLLQTLEGASAGANGSTHELSLMVVDRGDTLDLRWTFNASIFAGDTVDRLSRGFSGFVDQVTRGNASPADGVGPMPDPAWNDTQAPFPGESLMHELIEAQVRRTPDRTAVACPGQDALTYRALNRRANRLARHLRTIGVGPDVRVALLLERSCEMVVAILATLKAGGAYLPLDTASNPQRLSHLLADSEPVVVLTQSRFADLVSTAGTKAFALDAQSNLELLSAYSTRNLARAPGAASTDLAYILYTSGSTGEPKGVMVEHRAFVNRIWWMQREYALGTDDVVLQKTPYTFDVSGWEFVWPLITGASLIMARPDSHKDPGYLADLIRSTGVTTLHFVPSMLSAMLDEPSCGECTSIRRVFSSGEALSANLANRFFERLNGAELHNLYGPTEAAIDVSYWACRPSYRGATVPIGRPIDNIQLFILHANGEPAAVGEAGELYIGGVGLARGYFNKPEKTAASFLPGLRATGGIRVYRTGDLARYRPDGNIEFLGRIDRQVKIRGLRIDLSEIEHVLRAHEAVAEAYVDAAKGAPLTAFYVPKGDATPAGADLAEHLARRLPDHAIPALFVPVAAFPLTASGKLDRLALQQAASSARAVEPHAEPRSAEERVLCSIFAETLGGSNVGIDDGFFELGGDSISSLKVLARARAAGLHFDLEELILRQTVRKLAAVVRHASTADEIEPVAQHQEVQLPAQPSDPVEAIYPLSLLQGGMVYHSLLAKSGSTYHEIARYRVQGAFNASAFRAALASIAEEQDVLRTSFMLDATPEPLQCVWRQASIPLHVIDSREEDGPAQRERLDQWVAEERRSGFDWSSPPLLRCCVQLRGRRDFVVAMSFSHAILDGWSATVFLAQLLDRAQRDGGVARPRPRQSRFRDFVTLERRAIASDASRRFWQEQVDGLPSAAFADRPAAADDAVQGVARLSATMDTILLDKALSLAARLGVSVRTVLLSLHLTILGLLTSEGEIVTGVVVNGRPEAEDAETLLGLFLNTLPLRWHPGAETFAAVVATLAEKEAAISRHRRFPLHKIQELSGGRSLFDVVFHYVNFRALAPQRASGGWTVEIDALDSETNFPLLVSFMQDEQSRVLRLQLTFRRDCFEHPAMERVLAFYVTAIESLLESPDVRFDRDRLAAGDPEIVRQSPLAPPTPLASSDPDWDSSLDQDLMTALSGVSEIHTLPLDRPRPARQACRVTAHRFVLDAAPAVAIAGSDDALPIVRAAFVVLVGRLGRTDDVVVGFSASVNCDAADGAPCGFDGAYPLRAELPPSKPVGELLRTLATQIGQAETEDEQDLAVLAEAIGHQPNGSHAPLCQIILQSESNRAGGAARHAFDLCFSCDMPARGNLECRIAYDPDLFAPTTITMMAESLRELLRGSAAQPGTPVSEVPLVGHLDCATASRIDSEQPSQPSPAVLHDLFRSQARLSPDRVAVADREAVLTYKELDARSDALAAMLIARGVRPESRVGLCLPRSPDMIVSILAVLKAAAAYVPLDPAMPPERLRYIAQDSEIALLLSHSAGGAPSGLDEGCERVLLDAPETARALAEAAQAKTPWPSCSPDSSCYVIYTSGSTGNPKGVVVEHRNVGHLFDAARALFAFGPKDVWTLFHSYAFDFSVWEIFGALLHGGKLVIVQEDEARSPKEFLRLLRGEAVTILNQTPSAFYNLLGALSGEEARLDSLRYVIFGGEALDPRKLRLWFDRHGFDKPALVNMYGITETTVHVTFKRVGPQELDDGLSAIGRPLPHLSAYVLDEALNVVPRGAKGELCVGGAGVARGYFKRPELTRERFVELPHLADGRLYRSGDLARMSADGELDYLGRIDRQVKIRGYRIELGEIESHIAQAAGVSTAIVRVLAGSDGPDRLVAYIVPSSSSSTTGPGWEAGLREALGQSLPDYMVPSFIVLVDALPLTANGKIDLSALPDPTSVAPRGAAPRGGLETALVGIFEDVTQFAPVSVDDDFYAIGGDSIRVIQVLARLEKLGHVIDGSTFLKHRTVARLAQYLKGAPGSETGRRPAPLHLVVREAVEDETDVVDSYAVTDTQQLMLDQHEAGDGVYHPQHLFEIRDPDFSPTRFAEALQGRVAERSTLRSRFVRRGDGRWIQVVASEAGISVGVTDLYGSSEEEGHRAVEAHLAADLKERFDVAAAPPLMRAHLFRLAEDRWNLALSSHHAIEDGWGFVEFVRAVMSLCIGPAARQPLPAVRAAPDIFKERVALEREASQDAQVRAFWVDLLSGVATPASPRAAGEGGFGRISLQMSTSRLESVAKQTRLPLRSLFLFAYMQALEASFGRGGAIVDVVTNARSNRLSDPTGAFGLFWSLLPVPFDVGGGDWKARLWALDDLLAKVEQFGSFPVADLLGAHRASLCTAAFNYTRFHNAGAEDRRFSLLAAADRFHHPVKLAISVGAEGDNAAIELEYDCRAISSARAAALVAEFKGFLASLSA